MKISYDLRVYDLILGNLFSEAESIAHRSSNLQARIDRIAVKVTQLDSTVEEGKLASLGQYMTSFSSRLKLPQSRELNNSWVGKSCSMCLLYYLYRVIVLEALVFACALPPKKCF